jgi:hypothetical protein
MTNVKGTTVHPDQTSPLGDTPRVPKVIGADVELGNFIEGLDRPDGTGAAAARRLLREIDGVPARTVTTLGPLCEPVRAADSGSHVLGYGRSSAREDDEPETRRSVSAFDPQDWGRRFLPSNGASVYIDNDHLELAQPETLSAFDFVAYSRAMLRIARGALVRANERVPAGCRVVALANNSDGLSHSYGSHVSVLLSRSAWDTVCARKPHYLAYLAAFQASSIVYTGAGKVGSENGRSPVAYQLSQRADFFETMVGPQTVFNRPLINSRDEPLCGSSSWRSARDTGLARLHCIFYDHTLSEVATLLKAGTFQIVAAMLEACAIDAALALDDPIDALLAWSRDPSLTARARTVGGVGVTAVDLQFHFLDEAKRFADRGGLDGVVPRADEILSLWEDTLERLRARDVPALARRLDWLLKLQMLQRARTRASLAWTAPELKHLDHIYASLDEREGVFWAYEREGLVDRVVSEEAVARAVIEPPVNTRAWTRAQLLRLAGTAHVEYVDWDAVRVKLSGRFGPNLVTMCRTIELPHPAQSTEAEHRTVFEGAPALNVVLARLAAHDEREVADSGTARSTYPFS